MRIKGFRPPRPYTYITVISPRIPIIPGIKGAL